LGVLALKAKRDVMETKDALVTWVLLAVMDQSDHKVVLDLGDAEEKLDQMENRVAKVKLAREDQMDAEEIKARLETKVVLETLEK
jgi:hypothetical protein